VTLPGILKGRKGWWGSGADLPATGMQGSLGTKPSVSGGWGSGDKGPSRRKSGN